MSTSQAWQSNPAQGLAGMGGGVAVRTRTVAPSVNLLPPEFAEREKLRKIQMVMGVAVTVTMLGIGMTYLAETNATAAAEAELNASRAVAATLQQDVDTLKVKTRDLPAMRAAEGRLTQAMGEEVRWSGYLAALSRSVPAKVWLTDMSASTAIATDATGAEAGAGKIGQVTFKGYALKHSDVATWLEALQKQKGYTDAWSRDLKTVEDPNDETRTVVGFDSSVTVTADARSGRFDGGTN